MNRSDVVVMDFGSWENRSLIEDDPKAWALKIMSRTNTTRTFRVQRYQNAAKRLDDGVDVDIEVIVFHQRYRCERLGNLYDRSLTKDDSPPSMVFHFKSLTESTPIQDKDQTQESCESKPAPYKLASRT